MPVLTLPDGNTIEVSANATALDAAGRIGPRLAGAAVAAKLDGAVVDLGAPVDRDARFEVLTSASEDGLAVMRHSCAHVMAAAVLRLFPETKLAIGPSIRDGFYYDVESEHTFSPEDFAAIEAEMAKIAEAALPFERYELPREEALVLARKAGDKFKAELIRDLPEGEAISFYKTGDFEDLCRGPHVPSTGRVGAFKLVSVAGAYWRGDSRREQLQRIYGTAFVDRKALEAHLARLEEAKKRDHRRLGVDLDLFSFHEEAPGFPFWHPRGTALWNAIESFWRREHLRAGYQEIRTPMILAEELWHRSGHWDKYRENMYFVDIDDRSFAVKPMNCPGGLVLVGSRRWSYRDFPIRWCEMGLVHRHELSGVLHGMMRVRAFTQDDAHIFCLPDQINAEVVGVMEFIFHIYRTFGFDDYHIELSTRPERRIGTDAMWDAAENALERALKHLKIDYQLNPGDGAFYGPKIDFHIRDCLGRTWQAGTVQLDFAMPDRFDIEYVDRDDKRKRPVMIHRALLGSFERFVALLVEHYAGALPTWLSPVQVRVASLADRHVEKAKELAARLAEAGLRVETDLANEKIGAKVRTWSLAKVPYLALLGDREIEAGTAALRVRGVGDVGALPIEEVVARIERDVQSRGRAPE